MFAPHGTAHSPQVALGFVSDTPHTAPLGDAVGSAHQGDVFGGEGAELDALPSHTAVHLFVALAPGAKPPLQSLVEVVRGAEDDTAVILQLVVEGDEEVEHLVAHLVRLVEDQERTVGTLKAAHHRADLLGYVHPTGVKPHRLHHRREPAGAILILAAGDGVGFAVEGDVLADGGALATAGTADDSHHLAIPLSAVEELDQLFVDIRVDDRPALGREPDLLADVVPHPFGDGRPVTVEHLADGGSAGTAQRVGGFVLPTTLRAVVTQAGRDEVFFFLFHCCAILCCPTPSKKGVYSFGGTTILVPRCFVFAALWGALLGGYLLAGACGRICYP